MAMTLNAKMNQSQRLAMTQSMRQSIEMLQLNSIELAEMINTELEKNPVLEEEDGSADDAVTEQNDILEISRSLSGETTDFEKSLEERILYADSSDVGYSNSLDDDSRKGSVMENAVSGTESLKEHLLSQIALLSLPERILNISEKIITALDDDGYFRSERETFCSENEISQGEFISSKRIIMGLDPAGCGAENAVECLLQQSKEKFPDDAALEFILKNHFSELSSYKYEEISSCLDLPIDIVLEKIRKIRMLSPYPGNRFASGSTVFIIPDLEAAYVDGEIIILINDDYIPRIRISSYYLNMLRDRKTDSKIRTYIRENVNSAKMLIKNVAGRNETLYKIAKSIFEKQSEFFKKGPGNLKPLIYADISEETGFAESTISRISVNKFVQTHWGVLPLKYFFVQKAESQRESDISSDAVLRIINDIVKHENPEKPCSDEDIVAKLSDSGISVARRTVAKYRDILNIPSSSKRKRINKINGGLL